MEFITLLITVIGLSLFEIISSIDNAVINADVLGGMSKRGRRWFLVWGLLFAVFVVRGLLPWVIVWSTMPQLGFIGSLTATFSNSPSVVEAVEKSAPILLAGGGIFLIFLFVHWLFMEPKSFGLWHERFFVKQGIWFYATVSIILAVIVWCALKTNPLMAFGAVVGSTVFFITNGFKLNAEVAERGLAKSKRSDGSKILYLETIDATFSIDGVLGAFAFTLSVPLIVIGNGIGALVVRQLTVGNIERIKKYRYLKNGAMYSILFLGMIMLSDAFGMNVPSWISPAITLMTVGYFFNKSHREIKFGHH